MKGLPLALTRVEQVVLVATLTLITVIPLADVFGPKLFGFHVPGAVTYVKHLTLWLAFVGGLAAASQMKHLTLSTAEFLGDGTWQRLARLLAYSVSAGVVAVLSYASAQVVRVNAIEPKPLAFGFFEWQSELVMPVSLAIMAAGVCVEGVRPLVGPARRIPGHSGGVRSRPRARGDYAEPVAHRDCDPRGRAARGAGFHRHGRHRPADVLPRRHPVAAVSAEVYRLVASETLPAIPLLTAAGTSWRKAPPPNAWSASFVLSSGGCRAASR